MVSVNDKETAGNYFFKPLCFIQLSFDLKLLLYDICLINNVELGSCYHQ